MRSMTGFGNASAQEGDRHFYVELRSLNNRYFKASIRLPDEIAGLEAELESILRKRLWRGSLTLVVKLTAMGDSAAVEVNEQALLKYMKHIEVLQERAVADGRAINVDLTALMALPGVLQAADEGDLLELARPVVQKLVNQACDRVLAMRETEGATIAEDLATHSKIIRTRTEAVRERAPIVVEEYQTRLRNRIDELLKKADLEFKDVDIIKEVGVFADRADIAEEVSRMTGHLDQFDKIIAEPQAEPIGRTLEFIAQEMLREANTMASKSNDSSINRAIVEVKSAIDRIKEQAQNVE